MVTKLSVTTRTGHSIESKSVSSSPKTSYLIFAPTSYLPSGG
ncbi:unnamed protein product [Callosobruchus maculatus]|uniref:Uncharacterized protein n=1 Tax=Callosobruchus maculatus TaxID=64391 RepID=A0A653DHY8_CALMS|nr:unnamed protein product [Callosobruchus maculatus]